MSLLAKYFLEHKSKHLNLKGIAIGNGWYKPEIQLLSFATFGWENKLIHGLLSYYGVSLSLGLSSVFMKLEWFRAARTFQEIGNGIANGIHPIVNPYDIRKNCTSKYGPRCYNGSTLEAFMRRPDVMRELGVEGEKWEVCNSTVFDMLLAHSFYSDMTETLQDVLNSGLKVVLYNGNMDWLCPIEGMETFLGQLKWKGKSEFESAPWQNWFISGKQTGKYKRAANLIFYEVNDAGHLVALDQPEPAYDILTELIKSPH